MVGLVEDVIGSFGPDEGLARSFQEAMNFLMAAMGSRTLVKVPRWTAWRSMMENHNLDQVRVGQDQRGDRCGAGGVGGDAVQLAVHL